MVSGEYHKIFIGLEDMYKSIEESFPDRVIEPHIIQVGIRGLLSLVFIQSHPSSSYNVSDSL